MVYKTALNFWSFQVGLEEAVLVPLYAGDGYTTQWHQRQIFGHF
jgi:hypothetical protein